MKTDLFLIYFETSIIRAWPLDQKGLPFLSLLGKPLIVHVLNNYREALNIGDIYLLHNKRLDSKITEVLSQHRINTQQISLKELKSERDILANLLEVIAPESTSDTITIAWAHDIVGSWLVKDFAEINKGHSFFLCSNRGNLGPLGGIWVLDRSTIVNLQKKITTVEKDPWKSIVPSIKVNGYSIPVYPWEFFLIFHKFLEKTVSNKYIHPAAKVSKWASIEGPVYIDEEATVLSFASIKGPAYIGKNVVIGDHTLIRNSIIEENCVIGCHMEVARSIIQPKTETHSGFLGDSILDEKTHLGAGFISANLRLDRKNVRVKIGNRKIDSGLKKLGVITGFQANFGVSVSTMPGILVGKRAIIGPGTILFENVPDDTIVYSKCATIIRKKESKV
ncbi:MAG: hypothetical protein ACTSX9_00835 [Candidatus Njordarchaeales archaeon]